MRTGRVRFLNPFGPIDTADRKHRQTLSSQRLQSVAALGLEDSALARGLPDGAKDQEVCFCTARGVDLLHIMDRRSEPYRVRARRVCQANRALAQTRGETFPGQGLDPRNQSVRAAEPSQIGAPVHSKPGGACA